MRGSNEQLTVGDAQGVWGWDGELAVVVEDAVEPVFEKDLRVNGFSDKLGNDNDAASLVIEGKTIVGDGQQTVGDGVGVCVLMLLKDAVVGDSIDSAAAAAAAAV